MPAMFMEHAEDPREVLSKKIGLTKDGTIPGFNLQGNRVLLAIYERPAVTKSGVHLSDVTLKEDAIQGKAALVAMLGPSAFRSDDRVKFHESEIRRVGDWVMCFISHGLRCSVNGVPCRIIRDQDIAMQIPVPDVVW
jgi:co-chaperonin GroES (HSP10)